MMTDYYDYYRPYYCHDYLKGSLVQWITTQKFAC